MQHWRSRPAWARGLKLAQTLAHIQTIVAPRVGAWIETSNEQINMPQRPVAPRVGAWIETTRKQYKDRSLGRAPRGRVD